MVMTPSPDAGVTPAADELPLIISVDDHVMEPKDALAGAAAAEHARARAAGRPARR